MRLAWLAAVGACAMAFLLFKGSGRGDYVARQTAWKSFRDQHCQLTQTSTKWPGGLPVPRQIAPPIQVRRWRCAENHSFVTFDERAPANWVASAD